MLAKKLIVPCDAMAELNGSMWNSEITVWAKSAGKVQRGALRASNKPRPPGKSPPGQHVGLILDLQPLPPRASPPCSPHVVLPERGHDVVISRTRSHPAC